MGDPDPPCLIGNCLMSRADSKQGVIDQHGGGVLLTVPRMRVEWKPHPDFTPPNGGGGDICIVTPSLPLRGNGGESL
jgi:hypothetical protein